MDGLLLPLDEVSALPSCNMNDRGAMDVGRDVAVTVLLRVRSSPGCMEAAFSRANARYVKALAAESDWPSSSRLRLRLRWVSCWSESLRVILGGEVGSAEGGTAAESGRRCEEVRTTRDYSIVSAMDLMLAIP